MTALDPAVLRAALYALPRLSEPAAIDLAAALLQNLNLGERISRVQAIRRHAERHRQVTAGQIDLSKVTARRPWETMHDHAARAKVCALEALTMAIDGAAGAQTQADENARRTGQYSARQVMA